MSISKGLDSKIVGYPSSRGRLPALVAPTGHQLAVHFARAFYHDSSGSAAGQVGIMRLLSNSTIKLYEFNGTSYTQVTAPGSAVRIIDNVATAGFVVQARRHFGMVGINVSSAGTGTLAAKYWNGTTWASLTLLETFSVASTGIKYLLFLPPADWAAGGDGTLDSTLYSVRVTCAAGTSADVSIDSIWVASWIEFYEAMAVNTSVAVRFYEERPLILDAGEGIIPYFEVATTENGITVGYSSI